MLNVLLALCNVLMLVVFLYTTASLAIIGTAELIQRLILGTNRDEGLQDEEVMRLITPPLVTGTWLFVAWYFNMGMIPEAL